MRITREALWHRFRNHLCVCEELGLSLDISRMNFADDYLQSMSLRMHEVYRAMDQLEAGAIANVDEQRMVGHYWLRAPECGMGMVWESIPRSRMGDAISLMAATPTAT